jgi:hypothetical protein
MQWVKAALSLRAKRTKREFDNALPTSVEMYRTFFVLPPLFCKSVGDKLKLSLKVVQ